MSLRQTLLLISRGNFVKLKDKAVTLALLLREKWRVSKWRPSTIIIPTKLLNAPKKNEVGVFIHVYYADYLPRVEKILLKYSEVLPAVVFNFTATDSQVFGSLQELAGRCPNVGLVRLCANRGRNFGPLLFGFQDVIPDFKFVIHLHTKKSLHANEEVGKKWADFLWGNLLEDVEIFQNNLSLFRSENVSLLYPVDLKLLPPKNFSWANSRAYIPLGLQVPPESNLLGIDRFPFPAGGMFMASSAGLKNSLLTRRWSTDDFPYEFGQTDGTAQHALERLVGLLSGRGGSSFTDHIVFFPSLGLYTSDTSFCNADLASKDSLL